MKKILATVISLAVIFACLLSATYAWITINRKVDSNTSRMTIQSVSSVTTVSCFALQYDGICGAICYKVGTDSENGEVSSITMTEFDKIFRDRNVNTPVIFVLEIGNVPNETGDYISVKVPCEAKYILPQTGSATNNYTVVESGSNYSIQEYISNVLSVKLACSGNITMPTPTREERIENNIQIFTTQLAAFQNVSGNQAGTLASFSSTEGNVTAYSKEEFIELKLSQSTYGSFLFDATDENGTSKHLVLYLEFDYDDALMDVFINHITEDDYNLVFVDDLGTIQILTGNEGS